MNYFVIAQIFGAIGLLCLCLSYLSTTKVRYLLYQIVCTTFYFLQYLFLGAFSAAGINVITMIKSVAFFGFERKDNEIPLYALIITIVVTIIFGIYIFDGTILSAVPVVISVFYTYGTWQKNLKITYIFGTIAGITWLIYNLYVGAYVVSIGNIFEIASSIVGIHKLTKLV